jgi:hypothetical protein
MLTLITSNLLAVFGQGPAGLTHASEAGRVEAVPLAPSPAPTARLIPRRPVTTTVHRAVPTTAQHHPPPTTPETTPPTTTRPRRTTTTRRGAGT